jgi:transglutaminase-like putative cysteine protease
MAFDRAPSKRSEPEMQAAISASPSHQGCASFHLMLSFACFFFGFLSIAAAIPQQLEQTLQAAGPNREEIVQAWQQCPKEQKPGMEFLLEHMPAADAAKLSAAFLLENVDFAYRAQREFSWGREIPEEIFLNDVLPYASLDEARDAWRPKFYATFRKIVAPAKTATEALELIHQAITPTLDVRYNTKRRAPNQGPFESMQRKMATCTGLSILLADAARSVGLPARIVGIAQWTTKDGNHNWNEIYLPERKAWVATEYDRDQHGLNRGWFLADAARAVPGSQLHGIYATSWRKTAHHFPMVWDMNDTSVPAVDVTQRYLELGKKEIAPPGICELRIDVTQAMPDGTRQRIVRTIEVRQGDVLIARGKSPSPTDDINKFLSIKVPQAVRYQVILSHYGQFEQITPPPGQEHRRMEFIEKN